MIKWIKIIGFSFVGIIALALLARVMGYYQIFKIPSLGMEPALLKDNIYLGSNIPDFVRNDIVYFECDHLGQEEIWAQRMVGIAGDQIEIKDNVLYVNSILVDTAFRLKHRYKVSKDIFLEHEDYFMHEMPDAEISRVKRIDSIAVNIEDALVPDTIPAKKFNVNFPLGEKSVFHNKGWTIENFGPYRVPADHFFMLGDNREFSMDSRFIGPIHENRVKGKILNAEKH